MYFLKTLHYSKVVFGIVVALLVAAAFFATNPLSSHAFVGEPLGYLDSDGVPGHEPLLW
jgi:hypothetical protein